MAQPLKHITIPFELLFPMLVYYYAQLKDKHIGGEYGLEGSWSEISHAIDVQKPFVLTRPQFESLLYSYKVGVMDRRRPFKIYSKVARSYIQLLKELKLFLPDQFIQEKDGEIRLIGEGLEI